jgi:peroxiredoxin
MQMTRNILLLMLTGALLAAPLRAEDDDQKADKDAPPKKAKVGQEAPAFTLKDCAGKEHKLADYKDKIVVLEWVNQQCPWCIKAIPAMKKVHAKYAKNDEIVWLGIESTHWRTDAENQEFIKKYELDYPILMDQDGEVGRMYNARTTPHAFVIAKGKLVYAGAVHNDRYERKEKDEVRNYVDEALTAVLAGKDVPVSETKPWGCGVKYKKDKGGQRGS